jgi:hypothetical protein
MRGIAPWTCSTVAQFVRVTDVSRWTSSSFFYLPPLLSFLFLPPLDYVFARGTKKKYCYVTDEFLSITSPEARQCDRLAMFFIANYFAFIIFMCLYGFGMCCYVLCSECNTTHDARCVLCHERDNSLYRRGKCFNFQQLGTLLIWYSYFQKTHYTSCTKISRLKFRKNYQCLLFEFHSRHGCLCLCYPLCR